MKYSDYLLKLTDNIEYSEYITGNMEKNVAYTDYVSANLNHSIEYSKYLAETLDPNSPQAKRKIRMKKMKEIFGEDNIKGLSHI